jgi:hypothetical protein
MDDDNDPTNVNPALGTVEYEIVIINDSGFPSSVIFKTEDLLHTIESCRTALGAEGELGEHDENLRVLEFLVRNIIKISRFRSGDE